MQLTQLQQLAQTHKQHSFLGFGFVIGGGLLACVLGFGHPNKNVQAVFLGCGLTLGFGGTTALMLHDQMRTGKTFLPFGRTELGSWLEEYEGRNYPEWIDYLPEGLQADAIALWQSQPKQPTPPPTVPAAAAMPPPVQPEPAAVAITPPPSSAQWDKTQWELWKRIVADCPDLRFILMANLVVISGVQQGGKSTFASIIGRLRGYLLGHQQTSVSPHKDGREFFGGDVIGHGGNFDAIAQWYEGMVNGFEVHPNTTTSLLVDELTQYVGDWETLGQNIVRTALSESVKHGYRVILVNHAKTVSAGFAGIKGARELIESSAVQITRSYAYKPDGSQTVNPVIDATFPGLGNRQITIPDWLNLELLKLVQTPAQTNNNPTVTPAVTTLVTPTVTPGYTSVTGNLVRFPVTPPVTACNHGEPSGYGFGNCNQLQPVTTVTTPVTANGGTVREQVLNLLSQGVSESKIIKDHLGYQGRNYQQGKAIFDQLVSDVNVVNR